MNEFFKTLSDETRLRCLVLIFENNELCVCELIHSLELPQSKISRHLSILKLNKVIRQRREGQWVLYSMHPELSVSHKKIIRLAIQELKNTIPFKNDNQRLASMQDRPLFDHGGSR